MKAAKNTTRLISESNRFPSEIEDKRADIQMDEIVGKKAPSTEGVALERHYTVKEISEIWQLDEKMIRRIFVDEPGVVSIGSNEGRFRRAYRTLRIPESVLVRVHRRLRKAG